MPINLPEANPKRQLARKLFDAVISEIPLIGGPYAAMLSVTHPSKLEQMHAKWQDDVTSAINNIESIIYDIIKIIPLSDLSTSIGIYISESSKCGRRDSVDFDGIKRQFPDAAKLAIEDALGELEYAGLLTLSGAIGHKIIHARPADNFFEVFDPVVFEDANPRADAAQAARYIISDDKTVSAESIMNHFGWNVRRFNPAIAIVCGMIGKGRRSGEMHPTIGCLYVMPDPKERAALRHFATMVLGPV